MPASDGRGKGSDPFPHLKAVSADIPHQASRNNTWATAREELQPIVSTQMRRWRANSKLTNVDLQVALDNQRSLVGAQGALCMHVEAPLDVLRNIATGSLRRTAAIEISQMIRVVERTTIMLVI